MSDPTGGWAIAVEKVSETTSEVVKTARDAFTSGPLGELCGMAEDWLATKRFENRIRFANRLNEVLRLRNIHAPYRDLAPSFTLPLIEQATLEEDVDLQDIWASLLANALDASSDTERRTAFIAMLKDMTAFDVQILSKIDEVAPSTQDGVVYTLNFPNSSSQTDSGKRPAESSEPVAISLGNLVRLGCINPFASYGGQLTYSHVRLTALGKAFITACTSPSPAGVD